MSRYNRRQIALRIAYIGEAYQGFAIQEPPAITVEVNLMTLYQLWQQDLYCSIAVELSPRDSEEDQTDGREGELLQMRED